LDHDAGQAVTLEALPEGSGSRLTCWRADTGARLAVRELPPTRWLALAGSLVVSGDAAGIRLWNVALEPLGQAALEDVTTAAVSVDRSYLAAACGARVCWLGLPRLEPLAVSTLDGTVSDLALVGEDLAVAAGEVVRLLPLPAGVGTR
ncbi:MAG: hypothetical protein HUU35_13365, partial [Armatimonadetes bacterium]|nr:hypothetical protein [Armatimonadota bacterium]